MATRTAARPYVDYDYWHKLSDADKAWLTKFNREYYGSAKVLELHPKKKGTEIADQNNNRRRCYPLQLGQRITPTISPRVENPEDAYIDYLDHVKRK